MRRIVVLVCMLFLLPGFSPAQNESPEERLKALEERVRTLEAEIQELKAEKGAPSAPQPQQAAPPAGPAQTVAQAPPGALAGPSGSLPVYGGASAMAKVFNPDISIIGDFLGAAGRNVLRPTPALEMHETELGVQAIVDPYARGDFFLSFHEEGVELEEGYLTFTSLPGGFVGKVGKMRSSFGVVNTLHNHTLPWTDRPLVTENLVGGEDGITDSGLSVSRILPAPKGVFLEATAQVFRGDSGDLFQAGRRSDVSVVSRLRGYRDLTESTNLDLGFSYARGHNDQGSEFITQLYGMDATLRWKPLRRAIYHSFLARTELVWNRRERLFGTPTAFGFYTSGEYRINRRWSAGGRYDRSGRLRDARLTDRGFSALLTYWPSEFSQIRGQYRYTNYAEGRTGNEFLIQFLFSLGAHGAHPF